MLPQRRRLLRFGAAFLPLLALCVLAYPWVAPGYRTLLLGLATPVARTFSPPLMIQANDQGGWSVVRVEPDGSRKPVFSIPAESLTQVHLGIVLLPPLLLATPGPLRSRLRLFAAGLGLLVLLQLVTHLVFVRSWVHYQYTAPQDPLYQMIVLTHSISGQVFPVMLWGALTWRRWFPEPTSAAGPAGGMRAGRNRPCPCGSGRKYKRCCGAAA